MWGIPSVLWRMFNTPTFACLVLWRDIKIHVWRCSIQNPTFASLVYCGRISRYMCGGCSIQNPRIFIFSIVEGHQARCVEDVQFKTPTFSCLVLWRDIKIHVWRMFNSKSPHFQCLVLWRDIKIHVWRMFKSPTFSCLVLGELKKYTCLMSYKNVSIASILKMDT